jgi:hypothetical protein
MGIRLDQCKPELRDRILKTLNDAEKLQHELKASCPLQSPQPQPPVRHEPLAAGEGKKEGSSRVIVRITSFRQRLVDADNACGKSLVDGLRYAGLIPNDRPQDIELTVTQEKCGKKEERTEVELVLP